MTRLAYAPSALAFTLFAACGSTATTQVDAGADPADAGAPDAVPAPDGFQPAPEPDITAVTPDRGPMIGGTEITITGTGFFGNEMVLIGGTLVASTVVNDTGITATTPPSEQPGPIDVHVFNENGFDRATGGFTYNEPPTVTGIAPDGGSGFGGDTVTVTGVGFMSFDAGANTVAIGGADCADVVVVSDTEITCTTGPALTSCAPTEVTVGNTNGAGRAEALFTYQGQIHGVSGRGGAAGSGNLYSIDTCTGIHTLIGPIGYTLSGVASVEGQLYGSQVNGFAGGTMSLIAIDETTGAGTIVGPLTTATGTGHPHIPDLTAVGSTLYGWTENGDDLVTIDTTTGQVTLAASVAISSYGSGIGADAAGTIYSALTGGCSALRIVDKTTGVLTTVVGAMAGGCNAIMGMTFHHGRLYGLRQEFPGTTLVKIDVGTGVVTNVSGQAALPDRMESIASNTP
jgi:hypothetical protein